MTDSRSSTESTYLSTQLREIAGRLISGAVEDGAVESGLLCAAADEIDRLSGIAQAGRVPDREAFWLVERMGTGLYVKTGPGDLTDNVWHAHRFANEREAFDYARLSQASWAKDLRATEHLFVNKTDTPQPLDPAYTAKEPALVGLLTEVDPGLADALRENGGYVQVIRRNVIEECAKAAARHNGVSPRDSRDIAAKIRALSIPSTGGGPAA